MSELQDEKKEGSGLVIKILTRLIPLLICIVVGAGGVFYLAKQKPEVLGLAKNQEQAQSEIDFLVSEVNKLINLPTDEKPTVATVTDVEKVKEQTFFKNSKNGDKVLIYTNAKKAILYRSSEKRIIEVGAVNINQQSPAPSASAEEEPTEKPTPSPTAEATATPEGQ